MEAVDLHLEERTAMSAMGIPIASVGLKDGPELTGAIYGYSCIAARRITSCAWFPNLLPKRFIPPRFSACS